MPTTLKHKKGRPTKMGQLQIQRELRPYFEKGIFAIVTAEKTGIDKKTVNKYFDDWAEEMLEVEESKSLERQEMERVRIIASYDYLLLDAYRHFDDIDEQINQSKKEKKPVPGYLFSLRSDAMKFRAFMFEKKREFLTQRTKDDEVLDRRIEELIRKHEKSQASS